VRLALLLLSLAALAVPGVLLAAPRDDHASAPPPAASASPAPLPPVGAPRVRPAPPPAKLPEVRPAQPPRQLPAARAAGVPWGGRLIHGRRLPASGPGYITWDPILKQVPNRSWRRWGTGRLLGTVKRVLAAYARRHPEAPPVLVGDLSRPRGGDFGPRSGGIGHASHQNGLDADVYYPRVDGRLRSPARPALVDRAAAQELVDAFVRAGAELVFVGPSLDLRGPPDVVQPLVNHDNHLHVRLRR
jgi:murein endopeptidase